MNVAHTELIRRCQRIAFAALGALYLAIFVRLTDRSSSGTDFLGAIFPEVLQMFLFAGILVALFGLPADSGVTLISIALTLPTLIVANLLYFLLSTPIQFTSFWADNVWSLGVLLRFTSLLLGGAMLPLTMFPEETMEFLRYLPFVACYEFPVRVAMGKVSTMAEYTQGLAVGLAWCGVIGLACLPVWRRGQLGYTGVGI